MFYHTRDQHANHYTTDVLQYECIHSCDIFRFSKEVCSIEKLQKEFDILKSTIESMNTTAVMSHNDLLLKNLIYDKTTGMIDNSYNLLLKKLIYCKSTGKVDNLYTEPPWDKLLCNFK